VHGFFPFLYIKVPEYAEALQDPSYLMNFLIKLEMAYKTALKTDKEVIYKAELEEKYDFYGFHNKR